VATTHDMIEVMRRAFYDRARYLGDPSFVSMPLEQLTSKPYATDLVHGITPNRATSSADLGQEILVAGGEESTTHFSIVDRDGNAVSNTYTLEESFGSHVMVHGAGFILNSELTDFNLHPGHTDREGEIGTEPNQIAPGKRILSSQTPTIVLRDGKVYLVTGSPGSRTIINTVLHIIIDVIDFQMEIREAVDAPRMHHQWMPDVLRIEEGRLTEHSRRQLESMGHKFESGGRQGDAHSILVDPETEVRFGAADKRISGKAAGY
jgi:gamma-glutamyltranspeptidase/glutathione hydrolase